jgi:hypothetical protein
MTDQQPTLPILPEGTKEGPDKHHPGRVVLIVLVCFVALLVLYAVAANWMMDMAFNS